MSTKRPSPSSRTDNADADQHAKQPLQRGSVRTCFEVPPFAIRSAFATVPAVREYQLRQTPHGIDALVVTDGEFHAQRLSDRLESILHTLGIHQPEITVRRVTSIERNPQTGKGRRFIALPT